MGDPLQPHSSGTPKVQVKGKSQLQDESIMGTNNSSIVSKRSVERLYFLNEPHYFRFFVKKPQRRAPLINRGYWLRMKAIDYAVRQFLEAPSEKQKIIINLGCGYDPLPWQCLSRYPSACTGVQFIDVDYRDLMLKKRDVVQNTHELSSMLTNLEQSTGDILLHSDQYLQVGCDLRDISRLHDAISSVADMKNSLFLFTAEVSITYMPVQAANALIKWASELPEARFCLLEQLLPDGIDHPFAQTMMAHFAKLQTPLGAVQSYPTQDSQEQRFTALGWAHVSALNLWELWGSSRFLSSQERLSLDGVEPFDEWEEFALFACHYFLLVADNRKESLPLEPTRLRKFGTVRLSHPPHLGFKYSESPKGQGLRRFGAALPFRIPGRSNDSIGNFAGMGSNTRMASCDVYSTGQTDDLQVSGQALSGSPSSRMCHTITDLGDIGSLLVGGRTSPDSALADCWLYHKWVNMWERVDDLPRPQYRHSALNLGQGCVLISPGKKNSQDVESDFFIWSRQFGWRECTIGTGEQPSPTYGSTFSIFDNPQSVVSRSGILAGGISKGGVVEEDIWEWDVHGFTGPDPVILFKQSSLSYDDDHHETTIARFGATSINHYGRTYILGGIVKNEILRRSSEICSFPASNPKSKSVIATPVIIAPSTPRPLLIGSSIGSRGDSLVIMGGSAVCFSFGTFWNKGCFTLTNINNPRIISNDIDEDRNAKSHWQYWGVWDSGIVPRARINPPLATGVVTTVPRVRIQSAKDFDIILQDSKPIIIEALDLGLCTAKWTPSYLKERIGIDREVIVHEAKSEHMNFESKNFSYVTKAFGEFIEQADSGAKLYLRSLSSDDPAQLPADIKRDFPSIASDFHLPPELAIITENFHSSPLRISGPVIMWLHYDVMANVLCQIRGCKRLRLFPPSDIKRFKIEPGSSSTHVNVFDRRQEELLEGSHPYEAALRPGDLLFLPPLWLHTASPTSGLSVAVNVFFRNLQTGYAAGKDVYGNRDLQAYEKGRRDIAKIIKTFESLPMDVREFYLNRLVQEFEQLAN